MQKYLRRTEKGWLTGGAVGARRLGEGSPWDRLSHSGCIKTFTWLSGFPDDGSQPWVHTQMLACESLSSWDESVSVGHGDWLIEGLIEIDIFISDLEYKVEITLLEFIDGATSWEIAWSLSDKGRFLSVGPRAKLSDKDLWGYGDWAAHQWRCWRSLMSVVSKTFIL